MTSTILETEIRNQPASFSQLIQSESEKIAELAERLKGQFEYVLIAARGTSDNAARYAQYLFGVYNRLPVALATPSVFTLYRRPPRLDDALVIAISQSGQSPDIIEVILESKRQNRPTIAITNEPLSPLGTACDDCLPIQAGAEHAVAATKTYTTSLGALALLSCYLESDSHRLEQLHQVPEWMEKTLQVLEQGLSRVERYRYMAHCAVIGRGFNYATAFEIALKVKELTRVVAEPYSSADFRHGPIALARQGFPVMVIAPGGDVSQDVEDLLNELKDLEAELLVISGNPANLGLAHLPLPIPDNIPEWLTPMVAVIPGQLFGLHLALAKGMDPDKPAGLKKVTETT